MWPSWRIPEYRSPNREVSMEQLAKKDVAMTLAPVDTVAVSPVRV